MILLFPDPDTFHLALTGGFVPAEMASAKAAVAFDGHGRVSVETAAKLPRKASADLARLGVTTVKRHAGPATPVTCWPQILPAVRDAAPPQLSSQAPVLFELEAASDLPILVGEMLRLGNDRQSVRWLDDQRVLLRVIGPPYYTLLRALDQTTGGTAGAVRAYVEPAPRVWVQVGYSHPLAAKVALDEGQLLLVRPPREWTTLPEGPFVDVYDVLKFDLPSTPVDWAEAPVREKLAVPLRLVPGNAADVPELWVLRGDAAGQLDAFVRDADERVAQRLKFAVATGPTGEATIVLRVTATKAAPPVLPLADAVGFKPYHKLPNLYVPAGTRLHPTLRRDAVRKLLADDTDRLVWLYPGKDGSFTPETLPEDSFRPLEDWVDYVIETNHAPLAAWVEAARFDFEPFVCTDGPPPKPPKDRDAEKGRRRGKPGPDDTAVRGVEETREPPSRPEDPLPAIAFQPARPRQKSEWELRRRDLEDRFLGVDGPLDHPDRRALWPDLAAANAGAGDSAEAGLCWVNALWGSGPAPREWVDGWLRSECPGVAVPVTAGEFDRGMAPAEPTAGEVRGFAAMLVWLSYQNPVPGWLRGRLAGAQKYLEAHERKLPVRAVWLAASRLAAIAGADTLGLARVRDRLLLRLLEDGVSPEKDLPRFLRYAGRKDGEHVRTLQEKITVLHRTVRDWVESSLKRPTAGGGPDPGAVATLAYLDLFFAFGFARLGETETATALTDGAARSVGTLDPTTDVGVTAGFLLQALRYRVGQAIAGRPHLGQLPPEFLDELAAIEAKSAGSNNPLGFAAYSIARLRQQSRIVEPQEKLDPYLKQCSVDPLRKALAELPSVRNPQTLARTVREYYHRGVNGANTAETKFYVLASALPLGARVGEPFSLELLGLIPDVLSNTRALSLVGRDQVDKPGSVFEAGLLLAGHFDRRDLVQQLVDKFVEYLGRLSDEVREDLVNLVARQCIRTLRKFGLKDDTERLLRRLQDAVAGGGTPEQLRDRFGAKPDRWGKVLQSGLNVAGGWLSVGHGDRAEGVLKLARDELRGRGRTAFATAQLMPLAQAYVAALGHGPPDPGLAGMIDLFRELDPRRFADTRLTSRVYARPQLGLVEETVLAVVSDDFALGPPARRWLDEDELLVRRRVHADMRAHLARSGLDG